MNQFTSRGKSVEEAIDRGLKIMQMSKHEVNIEVLQFDTEGFMGIGKKQAIVKLSKSSENTTNDGEIHEKVELDQLVENAINETTELEHLEIEALKEPSWDDKTDGRAWIINNQLFMKSANNKYATASIDEKISLYKNGQLINKKTLLLSEEDEYKIDYDQFTEKPMSWKISIIKNGLESILDVYPGEKISYTLKDTPPSEHINMELEAQSEIINTLSRQDIIKELENQNITFGLNEKAIEHAIETEVEGRFVIALGKEAKHGLDGELEVKVDIDAENGLVEDENGNINFKDANIIPNVEVGTIMAILHPPIPGLPGRSVLDEEIPTKETHELRLVPGKGVDLIEDKIIATESGRPVIEQRGRTVKAMIMSKLVHDGNVNIASGNIRFSGDIEILGEVEDNMIVEAGGDIYVQRSISESNITASKSITAKGNVINSSLTAGKHHLLVIELGHLLTILEKQLDKMIVIIQQLTSSKAYKSEELKMKGLQPLIILLSEKKFKDFKSFARKYVDIVEKADAYIEEPEWKKVSSDLKMMFLTLTNETITLSKLNILKDLMQELAQTTESDVEPNSYITISDTTNSRIYSSGNVNIIGKGCINTKVHSGGLLKVDGSLRGGEVYGRLGVIVSEVGTISGTKTIISTASDKSITIMRAYEGTILRIGDAVRQLFREEKFIKAKLDENGQIIFE
ncbi:flagellar assembly protein A [Gracilibacillus massiliensis]|uniref:flagellar assembly protein A n=1 Tax=Gracilibacillus massiliensis TaxID=1564956 RepID=UPI00071DE831|nr:FapA family protein [Gracilibacillus massiliensis]